MGLLGTIREALGLAAAADATSEAHPDDLWGLSTAYVTMAADLDFEPIERAALCFAGVDSTDFDSAVEDVMAVVDESDRPTGTLAELTDDDHGYRWVVLEDADPEALVAGVHYAADTFIERDYGSRLLAAVFGFERDDERAYWIYSFRRGAYYPFAPEPGRERDSHLEFKLRSVLGDELVLEDDESYWYPLWPSRDGRHPWE